MDDNEMTYDEMKLLLLKCIKWCINHGYKSGNFGFTYIELGVPYHGEINPLHVSIKYNEQE